MDWAAIFWIMGFMGGFCLLLVFGELFTNVLYEISPHYRRWVDKQIDNLPDWDEEEG